MRTSMLRWSLILALAPLPVVPAQTAVKVAAASSYKSLKYPPLHQIKVPEPVRFELPNGMIVYLVEDHELPTIDVSARIYVGSRWEPVDKAGLASITGTVIRTGGSVSRNGDQLDEELDRLGASVETSIEEDSGSAGVSVLKDDIDTGLSILADLLQHPAFPQDKIDLAKIAERDSIARRNDQPPGIAFREFHRIMFGNNSAYGHQAEYATLDAIHREDLVAFHRRFFQPESVVLGAWGDFDSGQMRAKIEKAFGGWERGGHPRPQAPPVDTAAHAGFYAINKEDVNQSWVMMGFLGGKRSDPDFYALTVMNTILGGSGTSRLFSSVRTEQGLAYVAYSNWSAGWDRPGTFSAFTGTKSETTFKALDAVKHEIERMAASSESDITGNEFNRAKDSILKGFAFEFDSTGKIVGRMLNYEYYGYPRDYLQRYRDNIDKVTKADVVRVARQYLKADQLAILIMGKQKDFEKPLSSLGQVAAIDITIPQPKQEALAAATPESIEKGKQILAAACQAVGCASLKGVKDYTTRFDLTLATPQGEFALKVESTVKLTGKELQKMTTPMGEMTEGFDGKTAWMRSPQGVRDLPEAARSESEGSLFRDSIGLLQNFESAPLKVQSLGTADVGGHPAEGVAVEDPSRNLQVRLYFDSETHLLTKKVYTASLMGPPGQIEEVYSDYRDVNGLKMPFQARLDRDGKKLGEVKVSEIKINPGVEDSAFNKP